MHKHNNVVCFLLFFVKLGPDQSYFDLYKQLAILDVRNGFIETLIERNISCAISIQHT